MRVSLEFQVMGSGESPLVYKEAVEHPDPTDFSLPTSTTPFFHFLKHRNKNRAIFCHQRYVIMPDWPDRGGLTGKSRILTVLQDFRDLFTSQTYGDSFEIVTIHIDTPLYIPPTVENV